MKRNEDKCHVILSTHEDMHVEIDTSHIKNSCSEKFLGVKVDSDLNYEEHIRSICKKASAKLNALARVSPYNDEKKKMTHYKCFFSIPTLTTALLYGCSTVEN